MKLRRWKTTEVAALKANYRVIGADACADLLGRSRMAIWSQAYKLGLTEKDPRRAQRFHPWLTVGRRSL